MQGPEASQHRGDKDSHSHGRNTQLRCSPWLSYQFKQRLGQELERQLRPRRAEEAGESGKVPKSADVSSDTKAETATPSHPPHT